MLVHPLYFRSINTINCVLFSIPQRLLAKIALIIIEIIRWIIIKVLILINLLQKYFTCGYSKLSGFCLVKLKFRDKNFQGKCFFLDFPERNLFISLDINWSTQAEYKGIIYFYLQILITSQERKVRKIRLKFCKKLFLKYPTKLRSTGAWWSKSNKQLSIVSIRLTVISFERPKGT